MAQADNNVPTIGPRSFYSLVGMNPTLLEHRGLAMNGALPRTGVLTAPELDPVVSGGKAIWSSLTEGGLFPFTGKSLVIEAFTGAGNTWTIVTKDDLVTPVRATPGTFPFKLLPGEYLKAVGGTVAGVIARIDAQRTL